jgi:hypothetical protein
VDMSATGVIAYIICINPLVQSCVFRMPTHSIDVGSFDAYTTLQDGRKKIHFSKTIDLCNILSRVGRYADDNKGSSSDDWIYWYFGYNLS